MLQHSFLGHFHPIARYIICHNCFRVILMKNNTVISVTLPKELCQQLQMLAEETCRTRSGYIRQIIKAYLQNIEQHPEQKLS